MLLSASEIRVRRMGAHLREQKERLIQQARTWRASATMLRVNSALIGFPEMTALASRYDRLAEAAGGWHGRARGSFSVVDQRGLKTTATVASRK